MAEYTKMIEQFLNDYPEIVTAELLVCDTNGVLRGKRADAWSLERIFESGINLPLSVFGLDIAGETVEETGLGFQSGDMDGICTRCHRNTTSGIGIDF